MLDACPVHPKGTMVIPRRRQGARLYFGFPPRTGGTGAALGVLWGWGRPFG